MPVQYDALLKEVLALPTKDRALFAETVLDSLHEDDPDEVRAEWIAEIDRRLAAMERGETQLVPVADVLERLRRKYST